MKENFQKYLDKQLKNSKLKKEQKHSETTQAIRDAKQGIGLSKSYTDVNEMFDDILNVTITPEEFKKRMNELSKNVMELDDQNPDMPSMVETAHIKADELMCEILIELGYEEGIDIFKRMEKYYV